MLSHTVLLVGVGAVLAGVLGALVFGSNGTAEDQRRREEQKLLRALEAQRRIRDARLMREARRRGTAPVHVPPAPVAELEAPDDEPSADVESEPPSRIAARERKQEERERAAARKSERDAEKRALRRAEHERKASAKAERTALRTAERQQKHDAKAALKAAQTEARATEAQAPLPPPPDATEPEPPDRPKPLAELPLYSWANRIDDDDQPARLNT